MKTAADDDKWMRRALELARRGAGRTRPNPPVGAVVVRAGKKVGEGYHRMAGGPHAEVHALRAAGPRAKGATLYVTLEPCCTWGRTPPCTGAILAGGIRRVVVGVRDPNPKHAGRGLRALRRNGLEVVEGVCRDEAGALVAPFATWVRTGLPHVTLKLGMSADGRIADGRGVSRWITGEKSRAAVQRMRHEADAVLVGSGTVLADDPSLLCRACRRPHLWRVIADSRGRVPAGARVLSDGSAPRTILATAAGRGEAADPRTRRGAQVWRLPARKGTIALRPLLKRLGALGLLHVLCEGGAELAEALVRDRLVDEYVFFVAPKVLGGRAVPAVAGRGWRLGQAPLLRFVGCGRVGDDIMIRAVPAGRGA